MKKFTLILISGHLLFSVINASLITSGNGVSVAGRLNREGLTSTVIKTQQLNEDDPRKISSDVYQDDQSLSDDDRKNDDTHFRLYYKSNSPGRSLSHELEHRYLKNPNALFQQRFQENSPFLNINEPNYAYEKNKQTLLNLQYQSNPDTDTLKTYRFQQQQQQQQQQQKTFRNNILKMLLMNIAQNQLHQQPKQNRLFYTKQQPQQQSNDEKGLQYKIVHLKFRIEPQQGSQGTVETDNGAGATVNSKQFSLLPRELPELVRRLLFTAQQQNQRQQQPFLQAFNQNNKYHRYSVINKRSESDSSLESSLDGGHETTLEKRSVRLPTSGLETKINESFNTQQQKPNKKNNFENGEQDDKINDNEFQESLKSLQRRDDNYEGDAMSLSDSETDSDRLSRNDELSELDDGPQL